MAPLPPNPTTTPYTFAGVTTYELLYITPPPPPPPPTSAPAPPPPPTTSNLILVTPSGQVQVVVPIVLKVTTVSPLTPRCPVVPVGGLRNPISDIVRFFNVAI